MNTLEDLNNYSNTQLTYTDLRLPTIKFDTNYPPPTFLTIAEGSSFAAPVGANIIDLAQPAVVKATYLISFETTGFSVSFPVVSGVVVSHPTLTTWKVEGINSVDTWNLIKSPTITPPSGTAEPFSFTTVINSDLSASVLTQVNIKISSAAFMTTNTSLSPVMYRTSSGNPALTSKFTMTSKLAKMFSLQSNMNSSFTMIPTVVDFFKLSSSFDVLASADLILSTSIFMDSNSALTADGQRLITATSNQSSSFTYNARRQNYIWTRTQVNAANQFTPDFNIKLNFRNPQIDDSATRLMVEFYGSTANNTETTENSTRNQVAIYVRSGSTWSIETTKSSGFSSCMDSTGTWMGTYTTADDAANTFKIYNRSGSTWSLHSTVTGLGYEYRTPSSISSDGIWLATYNGIYKRAGTTWTRVSTVGTGNYTKIQITDDGTRVFLSRAGYFAVYTRQTDTNWTLEYSKTSTGIQSSCMNRDASNIITSSETYRGTYKRVGTTWSQWLAGPGSSRKYCNITGQNAIRNPISDIVASVYQKERPELYITLNPVTFDIDSFFPTSTTAFDFPGSVYGNTIEDYEYSNGVVSSDAKVVLIFANYLGSNTNTSTSYSRIFCYTRP